MITNRQSDNAEKPHSVQSKQPPPLARALWARTNWTRSVLSPWLQRQFKPGTTPTTSLEVVLKRGFLPALTTIQTKVLPGRLQHPVNQTSVQWPTRGILNPGRLDRFTSIIVNRSPMTKGKYERHQLEFRQAHNSPLTLAGFDAEEVPGESEAPGHESFESMLARAESFESMLAKTSQVRPTGKESGPGGSPPSTSGQQPAQIQRTSSRFEAMLSRVKQGYARSSRSDASPPLASQSPQAEAGSRRTDQPPHAATSKRAFSRIEELSLPDQTSSDVEEEPRKPITYGSEPLSVEESPPVGPMEAKPLIEPESSSGIAPAVQRQPTPEGLPQKSSDSADASAVEESRNREAMSEAEPSQVAEPTKKQQLQPKVISQESTTDRKNSTKEASSEENGVEESIGDSQPSQKAAPPDPLVPTPAGDESPAEGTRVAKPVPEISSREVPALPGPTEEQPGERITIAEPVSESMAQRPPEPEISLRKAPVLPDPTEEQPTKGTTIAKPVSKLTIQEESGPEMPQRRPPALSSTAEPLAEAAGSTEPPAELKPLVGEEAESPAVTGRSQALAVQQHVPVDQKREMPLRLRPVQETESGPEETQSLVTDEVALEPNKEILAKVTSRWRLPLITSSRVIQGDLTGDRPTNQMAVLPQAHIARVDKTEALAEMPALTARLPLSAPRQMKGSIPGGQKSNRDTPAPVIAPPAPPPAQRQPVQPMAAQPVTAAPPQESSGVIQRADGIAGQPVSQPGTEESAPDLDNLARQVYPLIKRMLAVERQRRSSR